MSQLACPTSTAQVIDLAEAEAANARRQPSFSSRLISGGIWAFIGKASHGLFLLASSTLLARTLSPESFGTYLLAFSFVYFTSLVALLGFNNSVVRVVASSLASGDGRNARRAISISFSCVGVAAAVLCVVLWIALPRIAATIFHRPALGNVAGLVGVWVVLFSLGALAAEAFRGFHEIRWASLFSGPVYNLLMVIGVLVLRWQGRTTFLATLELGLCASACNLLLGGFLFYRITMRIPARRAVDASSVRGECADCRVDAADGGNACHGADYADGFVDCGGAARRMPWPSMARSHGG